MGLDSRVVDMHGGARKQPRSHNGDNGDVSGGPSESPRRDGKNWTRASKVSEVNIAAIPVPRWDVVDIDDHSGVDVGATRFAGVGYQGPATQQNWLAREVASKYALTIGGSDSVNADVMDSIRKGECLDLRRFGVFAVDSRSIRTTVDGNSRVTVCDAWSKHMQQRGMPAAIKSQLKMDMFFMQ